MSDLVILKDKKLVFSNFIRKTNDLPTQIPLSRYFLNIHKYGGFVIPNGFKNTVHMVMMSEHLNPCSDDIKQEDGPMLYSFQAESLVELRIDGSVRSACYAFGYNQNSFYCRGVNRYLEGTATVGHFLGDDAVTIYKEAFKACNVNLLPFYEVDIQQLAKGIKHVMKNLSPSNKDELIAEKNIKYFEEHFHKLFKLHE